MHLASANCVKNLLKMFIYIVEAKSLSRKAGEASLSGICATTHDKIGERRYLCNMNEELKL